jgi:hypothetical protein
VETNETRPPSRMASISSGVGNLQSHEDHLEDSIHGDSGNGK